MAFLAEAYTDNLQQKLKDLHGAWMRCFDKKLAAKAPVFKKKRAICILGLEFIHSNP
jgi:putative transposase